MYFLTLDRDAVLVALAIGALILLFGLNLGPFYFAVMIYFLVLAALVTFVGMKKKSLLKLFEKSRGVKNVLANGLIPLFMVLISFLANFVHVNWLPVLAFIGFLSSVATVTADKFSSELGVLDGMPRMIINFKKVRKGTSGGITVVGLVAGLLGSFLIAISLFLISGGILPYGLSLYSTLFAVTIGGFLGTVVDSILGFFEEGGIGNKFSSNFLASVIGSLIGMLVILIL